MKKSFIPVVLFIVFALVWGCTDSGPSSPEPTNTPNMTETAAAWTSTATHTPTRTVTLTVTPTMTATECTYIYGFDADDDDTNFSNYVLVAIPFTPGTDVDVNSMTTKFSTTSGSCGMGIYADNAGEPGDLVQGTTSLSPVVGWFTGSITPTTLTGGTTYWLVVIGTGGGPCAKATGGPGVKILTYSYSGTMPATTSGWGDYSGADVKLGILYCN